MATGDLLIGERLKMLERPSFERPKLADNVSATEAGKLSFGDILSKTLEEVNRSGLNADNEVNLAISGKSSNPHSALLALQEAEISFNLMTSVKDRLEQAYQQLVRMQL